MKTTPAMTSIPPVPERRPMMGVAIDRATVLDQALLFRLLQLYYFEATRWSGEDLGPDGLYECDENGLLAYFDPEGPDRAYIVRVDGMPAGFALVEQITHAGAPITELADLFVLPKYRRRGLADALTREIVLPGDQPWLIANFHRDQDAQRYWRSAFARLPFRSVRRDQDTEHFQIHLVNAPGSPLA